MPVNSVAARITVDDAKLLLSISNAPTAVLFETRVLLDSLVSTDTGRIVDQAVRTAAHVDLAPAIVAALAP